MLLKCLLFLILLLSSLFTLYLMHINTIQRAKPLPQEVADIYAPGRYQRFLDYKNDYRIITLINIFISLLINGFLLFSPFFQKVEALSRHQELPTLAYTILFVTLLNDLPQFFLQYYATFTIEEKYDKNKQTKAMFLRESLGDFVLSLVLYGLLFGAWYFFKTRIFVQNASLNTLTALRYTFILAIITFILMAIIMSISYIYLHILYKFTPLEEGPLKEDIKKLMKDCKKPVKTINVYNESKRSTSKNAFLMKLPFHKEFGIADNFLEENSHDELLAVLAHEVGHLKHQKTFFNYLRYCASILFAGIVFFLLTHLSYITSFVTDVNQAFHLQTENDFLLIMIIMILMRPIIAAINIFNNYVSRSEEYEADDNAVKEGYGQALIATFKQLSSDELIDVNPASLTEFLTYDHPGMYHRIAHIEQEMKKL